MDAAHERRSEDRLVYLWPIWFSEDFSQHMSPGQMLDISRGGIAFTYNLREGGLCEGQSLCVAVSLPRLDDDDPGSTTTVKQTGRVCRVETLPDGRANAAVRFDQPLELSAAEQTALEIMGADTDAIAAFGTP